jgi:hypothetical protein
MKGLKTMLVMCLGLGSTWAAWQIAPAASSAMTGGLAYAQDTPATETAEVIDSGPTAEEIEEQLKRIEAAMESEGEVKEFKPSEPLSADMAIDMSSEL